MSSTPTATSRNKLARVVVVENDEDQVRGILLGMEAEGLAGTSYQSDLVATDFEAYLAGLFSLIGEYKPTVVIIDLLLGVDRKDNYPYGIDVLKRLKQEQFHPPIKCIVLTAGSTMRNFHRAIKEGKADGYILKEGAAPGRITKAQVAESVARGKPYYDGSLVQELVDYVHEDALPPEPGDPQVWQGSLTQRDCEFLLDLEEGLTNRQIEDRYALTSDAVRTALRRIYHKLDLTGVPNNRKIAPKRAREQGLLTLPARTRTL